MNKIYLLLGSNMGNTKALLNEAVQNINQQIGRVIQSSSLYSTAAWGNTNQPDFLNQVIVVQTNFKALQAIDTVLNIENKMGRVRTIRNAPRTIDIDILFFNEAIITEANLTVPHPEIANRRFVLVPLNELCPGFVHPVLKKTIHQLLTSCSDELEVKKL